jgi:hypothetical protein
MWLLLVWLLCVWLLLAPLQLVLKLLAGRLAVQLPLVWLLLGQLLHVWLLLVQLPLVRLLFVPLLKQVQVLLKWVLMRLVCQRGCCRYSSYIDSSPILLQRELAHMTSGAFQWISPGTYSDLLPHWCHNSETHITK